MTHHGNRLVGVETPLEGFGVLVEDPRQVGAEPGHEVCRQLVPGQVGEHLDDRHLDVFITEARVRF